MNTMMEGYQINLTDAPAKMMACAKMMAQSDPWITLQMDEQQCIKAFEGACKDVYVMETEHDVIGFAVLQLCGTFKGYIQTICISETFRGKGLGRTLLHFCEERILTISPNVFICVSSFNTKAIKLYNDLGFRLVGELDNFVKDGFTELLLRKTVGPIVDYQYPAKSTA